MMPIRKPGSSGVETPGSFSIGLSAGPMPPSRLAPWHVAQFWAYSVAPLLGSPGRAGAPLAADEPLGAGEGEVSASVDMAVSTKKAGIASTRRRPLVTRIEAHHIEPSTPGPDGNPPKAPRFYEICLPARRSAVTA